MVLHAFKLPEGHHTSHLAVIDEIVDFQDQRFEVERVIRIRPEIILNPDHRR
jgi:hypothetical protein